MMKWLQMPYPFMFGFKRNMILAFIFGFLSYGLNTMRLSKSFAVQHFYLPSHLVLIGFGFIVFLSILIVFQIFPVFIRPSKKNNWIVADEIKIILLLFSVMVSFIYIYFISISYTPDFFISQRFLKKMFLYFFSAAIPFALLVVWVNYTVILRQNLAKIKEQNHLLQKNVKHTEIKVQNRIIIPSDIKKEVIEFNIYDLLFVKSEGNYITLYQRAENAVRHSLHRISLHDFQKHISDYPNIMQVHRSYLVNIQNISHTQGNARNYQLFFNHYDGFVPVSRNKFKEFNIALKALS